MTDKKEKQYRLGTLTLRVRMPRHCSNAQALAEWLRKHPAVARVNYPGLPATRMRGTSKSTCLTARS